MFERFLTVRLRTTLAAAGLDLPAVPGCATGCGGPGGY